MEKAGHPPGLLRFERSVCADFLTFARICG
jgi:hypothetical protein